MTFDPHRAVGALCPVTFFPTCRWRRVDRRGRLRGLPIPWAPSVLATALLPAAFDPHRTSARTGIATFCGAGVHDRRRKNNTSEEDEKAHDGILNQRDEYRRRPEVGS